MRNVPVIDQAFESCPASSVLPAWRHISESYESRLSSNSILVRWGRRELCKPGRSQSCGRGWLSFSTPGLARALFSFTSVSLVMVGSMVWQIRSIPTGGVMSSAAVAVVLGATELGSAEPHRTAKSTKQFVFLPFGTPGTIRIFCCFAPAFQHRCGQKKDLSQTPCFAIRFLCFFYVFHARFLWVSGHLPTQSKNGVAQMQLLSSVVVFVLHAVIPVEGSLPPETNAVSFFCFGNKLAKAATVLAPVEFFLAV